MPPRLKNALSFSAFAGLILLGDIVHRLTVDAEAEMAELEPTRDPKPSGRSKGAQIVPWVITCLSVAALIIVLATK